MDTFVILIIGWVILILGWVFFAVGYSNVAFWLFIVSTVVFIYNIIHKHDDCL